MERMILPFNVMIHSQLKWRHDFERSIPLCPKRWNIFVHLFFSFGKNALNLSDHFYCLFGEG